jgi:hypothetical protein
MKQIEFELLESRQIYNRYIKQIEKSIATLSKTDRQDILMEFNSHIFEGINKNKEISEKDNLVNILNELGTPKTILKPLVADKKLLQATKTFNPIHISKALVLNISNGVSYILFGILYLLLLHGVYLIYSKLKTPTATGIFFKDDRFFAIGTFEDFSRDESIREVIGHWFIPVITIIIIILYILITLSLKLKRTLTKKT